MKTRHLLLITTAVLAAIVFAAAASSGSGIPALAEPVAASDELTPDSATTVPAATVPPPDERVATTVVPATQTPQPVSPTTTPAPTPPPALPAPPPAPAPFVVDPDEVHAAAKQLGGEIAQALTTYDAGITAESLAADLAKDASALAALTEALQPLLHTDSWSRGTVVYPQLGGMTDTASSIMVVVRQEVGRGGATESVHTRTLDIRLQKTDGEWTFAALASAGGVPVARPTDLSAEATAVVDNPRIELPDSARWDVYRGHTSPTLLALMNKLAERTPFGVVVLASGHPHNVFATDRTSNHTVGRAVDVYMIDGTRVIDGRAEGSGAHDTLRWLFELPEVSTVGGPWALDGVGGRSFTDIVHQDHLHIAVGR